MLKYVLRRFANYAFLLFIAVSLAYILSASFLHPETLFMNRNPPLDPASVQDLLNTYNLNPDTPVHERYVRWLTDVVTQWNWGFSPQGASVNKEIATRIWVSLRLVTVGAFVGMVGGVSLGAWTATRQYSISDRSVSLISLVLISTPTIVVAVILQVLAVKFNQTTGTEFFEFLGETGRHGDYPLAWLADRAQHLLLPTVSMSVMGIASYSRYQRNLMLDTLGADYVRTARAKGLRKSQAVMRHALRTALIPMGTYFAFAVTGLVLGAAITEMVYGWHGMGIYGVNTIQNQDVNGTVAVTAFTGIATLTGALLSDIMVAILDPRVRIS